MPAFTPFLLEEYQSLYERTVEYNLADSSVKCVNTREWLTPDDIETYLDTGLFYPEVNGTTALRDAIAALYPGADRDNVLVTVGAAEANSLVCQTLLQAGDEVVVMTPGYRQIWGTAHNMGCNVRELPLDPERGWRIDASSLATLITPGTRLVAVVNPNNPTGSIMTSAEMQAVVDACARVGAWLHVDEVYTGTEYPGVPDTRSFWGMYDRLILSNSLSKAYGLAGLRIGWAVSNHETVTELWRRHEYATIAAAAPSMTLATIALQPAKRAQLFARQRSISQDGVAVMRTWIAGETRRFSVQPAQATSIAFVRMHFDMTSYDFAEAVRTRGNVLIAPGSTLGAEHHLRITVGYPEDVIRTSLQRVSAVADALGM
ncbi:MAG: hypothetical protein RLZZ297_1933 [Chloroflexota bacterium]|jgi:aspartate/methionine/tyrosine aminotransferase